MRQLIPFLLALALTTLPGFSSAAPAWLRVHFAGTRSISTHSTAADLRKIAALPQGGPVAREIARQLATHLAGQWIAGLTNAPVHFVDSALEAIRQESLLEVLPGNEGKWRLAVYAPGKLSRQLQDSLRKLVSRPDIVIEDRLDSGGSWRFIPKGADRAVHVSVQREWLVIDSTGAAQPTDWRAAILREGRPPEARSGRIFALEFRSELLQQLTGLRLQRQFHASFHSLPFKERQRITGTVEFDEAPPLKLEEFILPTNTLRDPLISFTAARGIAGWFKRPEFRQWRLPEHPNQLIAWTRSDVPMFSMAALPMQDATGWLKRQTARFEEVFNARLAARSLGSVTNMAKYNAVVWKGLPLIAPFVTTAPKQEPGWLFFGTVPGFMPQGPNTNPPPAELLAQIRNRPDLIYYHWEVTEPRLQQWRNITDIGRIIAFNSFPAHKNPFPIWLKNLEPLLGNTITEITRQSDRRWKLLRNAQFGLTAMELALLTHWLTPTLSLPALPALPGQ